MKNCPRPLIRVGILLLVFTPISLYLLVCSGATSCSYKGSEHTESSWPQLWQNAITLENQTHFQTGNNRECDINIDGGYSCESKENMLHDMIHVVLSVDKGQFQGVLPVIQSLKLHNENNNLTVHIVVKKEDVQELKKNISCGLQMQKKVQIDIVEFDVPKSLQQLIIAREHASLSSTSNFARFYFYEIFPSLSHILYLDVDTLVQHDISELWKEVISAEELLVVVPRSHPNYKFHFQKKNISQLFWQRYGKEIDMRSHTFNAGILGINLNKWRKNNITREVIYWMTENRKTPLWSQGTQPILYIVGYKDWKGVKKRWNVEGLGWRKVSSVKISEAYILHWSGQVKPWHKEGRYFQLWNKYDRGLCSKRGTCEEEADSTGVCVCNKGFKGKFCEERIEGMKVEWSGFHNASSNDVSISD